MPTVKDIAAFLEDKIPSSMKQSWDNVGLLVGFPENEVSKCMLALDATTDVIREAAEAGAELIVAHHPVLFQTKTVLYSDYTGRVIIHSVKNNISIICMHTNLDSVYDGVNAALMDAIEVPKIGILEPEGSNPDGHEFGIGYYGELAAPVDFRVFLARVYNNLSCHGIRYYAAGGYVKKIACCGGSGGDYISRALALGCDTLVTSDMKHHHFLEAREMGLNVIDAGHFCTENIIMPKIAELLSGGFKDVEFHLSASSCQAEQYF